LFKKTALVGTLLIIFTLLLAGCDDGSKTTASSSKSSPTFANKLQVSQPSTNKISITSSSATSVIEYGNTPGNITNGGIACQKGDWIYYTNYSDGYKLYRIRTDGSDRTKLNDDGSSCINVVGDWVYYNNGNDHKLYKIRTDGSDRTKLNDDDSIYINVVGDWVYYNNESDEY
jgi:hypothetical protein